ncbi:MAG: hypothetical protein M0C28_23875 [Candidatus Moduliflexus flocculans]|nr:hypothetical protein [Candidatus Moduliflexus flocculans]
MFKAATYVERRKLLRRSVGSGLIIFLANEESPMNYPANTYHYRQDSTVPLLLRAGFARPGRHRRRRRGHRHPVSATTSASRTSSGWATCRKLKDRALERRRPPDRAPRAGARARPCAAGPAAGPARSTSCRPTGPTTPSSLERAPGHPGRGRSRPRPRPAFIKAVGRPAHRSKSQGGDPRDRDGRGRQPRDVPAPP